MAVGRGGVEPPTFRFSDVAIALVAGNVPRSAVLGVCRWSSVVADVVVSVVVKPGALRAEHPVVAFVPASSAASCRLAAIEALISSV
jgi:hypothetical protein